MKGNLKNDDQEWDNIKCLLTVGKGKTYSDYFYKSSEGNVIQITNSERK